MAIPSIPKKTTTAPAPAPTKAPVAPPVATQAPVAGPAAAPAEDTAEASTSTAVAAPVRTAVAVAGRPRDVLTETYKDAFKVDWNTLNRIQATNGNFVDVEANKAVIGTEIVFELMSFQQNWQISPGTDDDDDVKHVRYSDDGKFTTEGEDINEYVQALKTAGYDDAKSSERLILAGTIVGGSHDGKLVQLNLPPTSKSAFDRFKMQASIDIGKGKRTPADLTALKLKAVPQSKGKNTWTVVHFDYANPAA
jgi:hypothetical protein